MTAIARTIETIEEFEKRIVISLLIAGALVGVLYGTFLRGAIMNVVARETLEKEIRDKTSDLGSLETEYISLKNAVTLEVARARGFAAPVSTSYITAQSFVKNTKLSRIQ